MTTHLLTSVFLSKTSWKRKKAVQLSHPPYSPDLSSCDFFLFPLLKKTLSDHRYESQSTLGSAIYQCLQGISKKAYLLCLYRMDFETWKVFPSRENISKGWSKRNVNGINNAPCRIPMTTLNGPSYPAPCTYFYSRVHYRPYMSILPDPAF